MYHKFKQIENKETIFVTGGSGFIANYCMITLLNNGYKVKATLRSMKKTELVKEMLKKGGLKDLKNLSFVEAELSNEKSWENATKGFQYVIHTASPTPNTDTKTEDDFIKPAIDDVLFVLKAARKAGVKRVVLTSAFGTVGMGTNKNLLIFILI